jgi:hypothetical protein
MTAAYLICITADCDMKTCCRNSVNFSAGDVFERASLLGQEDEVEMLYMMRLLEVAGDETAV